MRRGTSGVRVLDSAARDLRYAVRALRREPTFLVGVVVTFALAISANAAIFGLVSRLMLSPPAGIRDAEHVAGVRLHYASDDGFAFVASTTSYPVFRALRRASDVFSSVAASRPDSLLVGPAITAMPVAVLGVSGAYLQTLGAMPIIGRSIDPSDDEPPAGNAVVVLSHAYWQRAFAGDRAVLGHEITVDGQPFTIVGVAARGFTGDAQAPVDLFVPLSASLRHQSGDWLNNAYMNLVTVVVRQRTDVAPRVAAEKAAALLRGARPDDGAVRLASVELDPIVPDRSSWDSPQARIMLWLAAVSVIVLALATANIATLLALRAARRRRDFALRIALGAARRDLTRQLLVEGVLLALLGTACGLVLGYWLSELIRVTLLPNVAPSERVIDARVLTGSVAAACVAGIVAGMAPLIHSARLDLTAQLASGGAHGTSSRLGVQRMLVGVQVALCTLLLVGASLFVRSLRRVESQDLGFSTSQLLYVTLDFRGYIAGVERDLAYYDALDHVRRLPTVSEATVAAGIPFGPHYIPPVSVPGIPWPPGAGVQIPIMYGATPEYLRIMDVQLRAGRLISARDGRGSPLVVLVNESLARTAWPGTSPLGKCVRVAFGGSQVESGNPAESAPCREVVGVVRDSRARSLRPEGNEDRIMQYYVPFAQLPESPRPDASQVMDLLVRVRGDLESGAMAVQRTIQSTSLVPVYARVRPYQDLIDPQLRSWRLGARLFAALGVLALALATVGVFGVVSYAAAQRTREIGVRLALGGTRARVARLVVGEALRMVSAGLAVGTFGALAAGSLIASMLFQTSAHDPQSLAVGVLILLGATIVASAWPAWRAGRVNPVDALRADG
jgi:putative ABC transport system permease protein